MSPEKLAAINTRGLKILMEELGPGDFVLFMAQNFAGKGDYSRDRHKLLPQITLTEIAAELEARKTNKAHRS